MIAGLPTVGGSLTGLIFLMARRTALAALADGEAVGAGGTAAWMGPGSSLQATSRRGTSSGRGSSGVVRLSAFAAAASKRPGLGAGTTQAGDASRPIGHIA